MRRLKKLSPLAVILLLLLALWRASAVYEKFKESFSIKYLLGTIFLTVGLLIIYLRVVFLKSRKDAEYSDLRREFSYLSQNTLTGVIIGVGFASTLIGIGTFIYQPEQSNIFQEKIFEILTIYLTTITSLLVIRAIFDKIAPITNVEKLLLRLAEDFEDLSEKKGCEAWIIYPALNIGHFREEAGLVPESYYVRFSEALHKFIENPFTKLTAVTYKNTLYDGLYKTYTDMVLQDKAQDYKDEKKNESIVEAKRKFNAIKDASNLGCACYELEPDELREHFIVIDDIVYMITSFGLPIYEVTTGGENTFKMPEIVGRIPKEKLVKIYAYRQQDGDLANMIKEKVKKSLEGKSRS